MSTLKGRTKSAPGRRFWTARLAGLPTEGTSSRRVCRWGALALRVWPARQRSPERTLLFSQQRRAAELFFQLLREQVEGGTRMLRKTFHPACSERVREQRAKLRRDVSISLHKQEPGHLPVSATRSRHNEPDNRMPGRAAPAAPPRWRSPPHAGRRCCGRVPHRAMRPGTTCRNEGHSPSTSSREETRRPPGTASALPWSLKVTNAPAAFPGTCPQWTRRDAGPNPKWLARQETTRCFFCN